MQELGLRILFTLGSCARPESGAQALPVGGGAPKKDVGAAWEGQPCHDLRDEAQSGVQTPREDCTAVRRQNCVKQGHSASGHAQCCAQLVRGRSLLVPRRQVTVSPKEITLRSGISEPAGRKLQLIDSIQQTLLRRRGTRNANENRTST